MMFNFYPLKFKRYMQLMIFRCFLIIDGIVYHLYLQMSQRKFSKNISNVSSVKVNQNQLTPRVNKTSKSPVSNSKYSHQTVVKQTVSYGQLQIVLENIHSIKEKASSQVKQLNQENTLLRDEINQMESCIDKLTSRLKEETESLRTVEDRWKTKIEILQQQIDKKQTKIEERDSTINSLNMKVGELQRNVVKEKERSDELSKELEEMKRKWSWAFTALAGDETRAEEIVWKIKHSTCNLWQILQKISSLQSIMDLKTQKIESLANELSYSKQQHRKTSGMFDKALTELNSANDKIGSCEQQLKQYYQKVLSFKDVEVSLQQRVTTLTRQNKQLTKTIQSLQQRLKLLSQELLKQQFICCQKDKKIEYDSCVSQICDENEDYGKVLDRLRYLERFRKEHYFNVEKIQFLCKLIDQ